ncbi:hypothetical protein LSCM4_04685 [Leishmania orientalis]|uniref:Uncharacterized protein n=1 Tax=Leishmania orientalis TaxID=2249476 RepID=A0A836GAN9_9TRYP|nr:hypothetical protein LSCM4_04685 [Leishmania orientalis]
MSLASSCAVLCAPLTAVAAVLLFMMSHMLRHGNWTFEVLAAKHGWEREAKANACMRGGLLYLLTSLVLWLAVLLKAHARRLWMQLQWSRKRGDEWASREALLHGDGESARQAGGRYGRRAVKRPQSRRGSGWREEGKEMSALDWGGQPVTTSCAAAVAGGLLSGADMLSSAGAGSPTAGRFPGFQRNLIDAAGFGSDNSPRFGVDSGSVSTTTPSDTTGVGTVSRVHSRGLRSRGGGSAASSYTAVGAGGVTSSNKIGASAPFAAHTTGADSMDDLDFMSDVEVDGARHYTTPQLRVSGWGLHRSAESAEACGEAVLRGRYRPQARGTGGHTVLVTERGEHGRNGSAEPRTTAALASKLTSLWQTSSTRPSVSEGHGAGDRRAGRGLGPPAASSGGGGKSKSN